MVEGKRRKKGGPLQRAFLKGLSIILPAVITIAIFAWVWDILRVYVVELTIKAIDSVKIADERKLSPEELKYLDDPWFAWPEELEREGPVPHELQYLRRTPRVSDLPPAYRGYTPPGQERSVLQVILDANGWPREYDSNGRVIDYGYNWFDYLLASVLGLALVVLLGFLARNFAGRKLVALLEWFVTRVPVVKSIYPHAKQLVEFFFTDNKPIEFETVAIVEYPRRGLWAIVFVTGSGLQTLQEHTGKRMVTVYVPSSPVPMTGYTMVVAAEEVIQLDISVEQAMKFVVSGGVLPPVAEMVKPTSGAQLALAGGINDQMRTRQTELETRTQLVKRIAEQQQGQEDTGTDDADKKSDS
jgi:uncharacterized membrane protein